MRVLLGWCGERGSKVGGSWECLERRGRRDPSLLDGGVVSVSKG